MIADRLFPSSGAPSSDRRRCLLARRITSSRGSDSLAGQRPPARRAGAAFTLIEVLVVVAIIALLLAVLLPSLATARRMAKSAVCLSQLEQQGKAAFMYAHELRGALPACQYDAIERIPATTRKLLIRMVSSGRNVSRTSKSNAANIFYCPSNTFRPWTPAHFALDYPDSANAGRIRYWWVANPHKDQADRFLDTNNNQLIEDEYIRSTDQNHPHRFAISTDQSRQANASAPNAMPGIGWYFLHGKGEGLAQGLTDAKPIKESWKNTLYGDAHAESTRGFKVIKRWGPTNPAGW